MPDDLCRFCYQNQGCLDYGRRGLGNLTVYERGRPVYREQ